MTPMNFRKENVPEGLLKAQECFEQERVKLPYISADDKLKMLVIDPRIFGTYSNPPCRPYDINVYVHDALTTPNDYILFGFDGHGVASQGMHYYAVKENLAIFLQLKTVDPDRINNLFPAIEWIFESLKKANSKHLIPDDARLLIVESDFNGKGWGWIKGYPGKIEETKWHIDEPILMSAFNSIPDEPVDPKAWWGNI